MTHTQTDKFCFWRYLSFPNKYQRRLYKKHTWQSKQRVKHKSRAGPFYFQNPLTEPEFRAFLKRIYGLEYSENIECYPSKSIYQNLKTMFAEFRRNGWIIPEIKNPFDPSEHN